jgi:hypothetical protein
MLSWPRPFVSHAVDFDLKYRTYYLLPSLQWPPASVDAATLDKMSGAGATVLGRADEVIE